MPRRRRANESRIVNLGQLHAAAGEGYFLDKLDAAFLQEVQRAFNKV